MIYLLSTKKKPVKSVSLFQKLVYKSFKIEFKLKNTLKISYEGWWMVETTVTPFLLRSSKISIT